MSYSNRSLSGKYHTESQYSQQRGLPGVGLKLDDNGNYDMENKKID